MSHSASEKQDHNASVTSKPLILDSLPDVKLSDKGCSPRTKWQIDLLLLALEALELGGSEYMLATAKELELQTIVTNRVVLWRLRCTNPWRRSYTRRTLQLDEAKALVIIANYRARKRMVYIRQLLLALQQMQMKGVPLDQNPSLSVYLERFRSHFRSRMNPKRAKIALYNNSGAKIDELALSLLNHLLFFTGTSGMQRVWISLFDGEVA